MFAAVSTDSEASYFLPATTKWSLMKLESAIRSHRYNVYLKCAMLAKTLLVKDQLN